MSDPHLESAHWLARLDDRTPAAERAAFERWLAEPGNAAAHGALERLWRDELGALGELPELKRLCAQVKAASEPGARRRFRSPLALAASVALCAVAVAAFLAGRHYLPTRTLATDDGQRSTVQLDDGSRVILNFNTRLEVKYGADRRELRLKRGEAVFEVAEDPRRPFTVTAGDGTVTALGTRFQVRNESRRVIVTLLEGRVALHRDRDREPVQLVPGDEVRFSTGAPPLAWRTVDPVTAASWTTGQLVFNGTALAEVIAEVNRYVQTRIRLNDLSLLDTPVSGAFETGDSMSVISALQLMLPLEIQSRSLEEIVLAGKGAER